MRTTLLITLLFAASAVADEVHLRNGTVLEGQVREEGSRICVVDRDRKHSLAKGTVLKIVKKPSFMDKYEDALAALSKDDAEAIFEFGQWLDDNKWPSRARRAYEEVLAHDADHRGARRALGFKLYEGEWVAPDELNRRKGLIYFEEDDRWYTKHDLAELKKRIERDAKLRTAYAQRRRVNAKINKLAQGFASYDKRSRKRAHDDLYKYAEEMNSPELRKFADDTKAYYDYMAKVLCAKMMARTEIQATHTKLRKPIDTFQTGLGAAIAIFAAQNPVRIQLPELQIRQIQTTVDIPAGCK